MVIMPGYGRQFNEPTFAALKNAGWLTSFAYDEAGMQGCRVDWAEKGLRLASELSRICERFDLLADNSTEKIGAFHVRAQIGELPGLNHTESAHTVAFWNYCIADLGIKNDATSFATAINVVVCSYLYRRD